MTVDNRTPLSIGSRFDFIDKNNICVPVTIQHILSIEGGTSITYVARIDDLSEHKIKVLKELFPKECVSNELMPFRHENGIDIVGITNREIKAFEVQKVINNSIMTRETSLGEALNPFFSQMVFFEANGTAYIYTSLDSLYGFEEYIKEQGATTNIDALIKVVLEITEAVSQIHAKGHIHTDIKPSNIIATGANVKMIDYGSCINLNDLDRVQYFQITNSIGYVCSKWVNNVYNKKCNSDISEEIKEVIGELGFYPDVYSVGWILYELLSLELDDLDDWKLGVSKKWGISITEAAFLDYVIRVALDENYCTTNLGEEYSGQAGIKLWHLWILLNLFNRLKGKVYTDTFEDSLLDEKNIKIIHTPNHYWNKDDEKIVEGFIKRYKAFYIRSKTEEYYTRVSENPYDKRFKRGFSFRNKEIAPYDGDLQVEIIDQGTNNTTLHDFGTSVLYSDIDKNVYIYGLGGAGKSWLLSSIYKKCIHDDQNIIPLYLDLSVIDKETNDDNELFSRISQELDVNPGSLIKLLNSSSKERILLLLDNMHRVNPKIKERVIKEIEYFNNTNNVKVFVFSRNEYFSKNSTDNKYAAISGIDRVFRVNGISRCLFQEKYGVNLPSSCIFNYPQFAFMYLDLVKSGISVNYDTDYPEIRVLHDYLMKWSMFQEESAGIVVNDSVSHSMYRNISEVLQKIAFNMKTASYFSYRSRDVQETLETGRFGDLSYADFCHICCERLNIMEIDRLDRWTFAHDTYMEFFAAYNICRIILDIVNYKIPLETYYGIDTREDFLLQRFYENDNSINSYWWKYVEVRDMCEQMLASGVYNGTRRTVDDSDILIKFKERIIDGISKGNYRNIDLIVVNLVELMGYKEELCGQFPNKGLLELNKKNNTDVTFIEPAFYSGKYADDIREVLSTKKMVLATCSLNAQLVNKALIMNYWYGDEDNLNELLKIKVDKRVDENATFEWYDWNVDTVKEFLNAKKKEKLIEKALIILCHMYQLRKKNDAENSLKQLKMESKDLVKGVRVILEDIIKKYNEVYANDKEMIRLGFIFDEREFDFSYEHLKESVTLIRFLINPLNAKIDALRLFSKEAARVKLNGDVGALLYLIKMYNDIS